MLRYSIICFYGLAADLSGSPNEQHRQRATLAGLDDAVDIGTPEHMPRRLQVSLWQGAEWYG